MSENMTVTVNIAVSDFFNDHDVILTDYGHSARIVICTYRLIGIALSSMNVKKLK